MTEPSAALNPFVGDAIEEDRSLASRVKGFNEVVPYSGETFRVKDTIKSIPTDRIKSLAKVELEDRGGSRAFVTGLDDVRSINEVFRNGAPRDEPGLIGVDEFGDEGPQTQG